MLRFLFLSLFILSQTIGSFAKCEKTPPNIVIIYTDDLGIGDVSAYGQNTLKTPNIDAIAEQGIRFENGYATSATCTPSRYSLLTGRYPWKNKEARVLPGNAPLLISTEMQTLPKMLKEAGYATGVVGKWHLGLGNGNVDWNKRITPSPNEIGFDYSYIMAATNDRTPTVFVRNGHVVDLDRNDPLFVNYRKNFDNQPTGKHSQRMLKMMYSHGHNNSINNGISRIGFQKGGKRAMWIDENMADTFLVEAQRFVKQNKQKPFFLYYALHQPHVPRVPHQRFAGKTGLGPRGDAIAEADWCIGEFINTLRKEQLLENTLIIFSSDNGPVLDDGYRDDSVEKLGNHKPSGKLRGGKYSLYEAGTRVPFLVMWQGKIKPQVSPAVISQVDLLNSLAEMTLHKQYELDSENQLAALMGKNRRGRKTLLIEGLWHTTALRQGDWVLIPPRNGPQKPGWGVDVETGFSKKPQLYNLKNDPEQKIDLSKQNPRRVEKMIELHEELTTVNE